MIAVKYKAFSPFYKKQGLQRHSTRMEIVMVTSLPTQMHPTQSATRDERLRSYMLKIYNYMALALV